jgi:hypothetical protein
MVKQMNLIPPWKLHVQPNLYIKVTQRNMKMWPLSAFAHYIQVKIICTNGKK